MNCGATIPVNLTCVVMFIPTTEILAPEVNTTSAASGSPYIYNSEKLRACLSAQRRGKTS